MFRFTIRDVLWLTVVVALGGGMGYRPSPTKRSSRGCGGKIKGA